MSQAQHPIAPVDETPEQRHARRAVQRQHDVAILAAGGETGWWDEHGAPAPWPLDFFDADTGWRLDTDNPPDPVVGGSDVSG
jgi:hypothetical protein